MMYLVSSHEHFIETSKHHLIENSASDKIIERLDGMWVIFALDYNNY